MYSKTCLKQRRQTTPPNPSFQQSRRYFGAEKVTWLRLLFASMPIQQVEKQNVPFIVHLIRLFPTAQDDQKDYYKSAEFLNKCHKSSMSSTPVELSWNELINLLKLRGYSSHFLKKEINYGHVSSHVKKLLNHKYRTTTQTELPLSSQTIQLFLTFPPLFGRI